ncbi:MarR family winged helix-turn-helix transcriptional regulator [Streptomyces sp. NPDC058382]|uniref:MarR family winged helix-turn-helix transcriptional regulator n=1 Tax=unclassified Streptomyces TaxID=2593676 RepID=UPI00364115A8
MNRNETPPSLLELTTYLMSRTGKVARGRLAEQLTARGLRLWHMGVLAALVDFGPHAQRELADRLSVDRSDIVKIVDDLAGARLAERARDTADRRRVTVTVSPAGRALLDRLHAEVLTVQDDLLAPLTGAERTQLTDLLRRVYDHVRDDGAAQRPGR